MKSACWTWKPRLGVLLLLAGLATGCGGEVKVPENEPATVEANRQKYEEMAKQERLNQ